MCFLLLLSCSVWEAGWDVLSALGGRKFHTGAQPYQGWGLQPAAGQKERKQKGKAKNQKFEALYNRRGGFGTSSRQPAKREGNRRGKPKIRNLRRYIIGGKDFGTSSRQPAKREGNKRGKPKIQKFEALYNRRGDFGTSSRQPAKREGNRRGKPKIRNLRRYIIGGGTLGPPAGSRPKEKETEGESQKSEI